VDEGLRRRLQAAREFTQAREWDQAERALREILLEHDRFADVWHSLGIVHHGQGRLDEAASAFERSLALNPAYTDAALNLAITYNDLGRYADARRVYTQAIKRTREAPRQLDPVVKGKLANMHADLGAAYAEVGLYAEAAREYVKALELGPQFADLRTRLAAVYRDMGDRAGAQRELDIVKTTNPGYLPARLTLGTVLMADGRVPEAIHEWETVLVGDPGNVAARAFLNVARGREAGQHVVQAKLAGMRE
jgi:tetratricopeptide (TPR) repeat protein